MTAEKAVLWPGKAKPGRQSSFRHLFAVLTDVADQSFPLVHRDDAHGVSFIVVDLVALLENDSTKGRDRGSVLPVAIRRPVDHTDSALVHALDETEAQLGLGLTQPALADDE